MTVWIDIKLYCTTLDLFFSFTKQSTNQVPTNLQRLHWPVNNDDVYIVFHRWYLLTGLDVIALEILLGLSADTSSLNGWARWGRLRVRYRSVKKPGSNHNSAQPTNANKISVVRGSEKNIQDSILWTNSISINNSSHRVVLLQET